MARPPPLLNAAYENSPLAAYIFSEGDLDEMQLIPEDPQSHKEVWPRVQGCR